MTNFKSILTKLKDNLNILREREAKYAGNAPLDLLNQITDHQAAIALTEQAITGELTAADWREAVHPLLVAINTRDGEASVSNVTIGNIHGSIIASEIAGRDISIGQKIVNIFTGGSKAQRDLRNRQIMLQRVHDFWVKGVLENSLHNEVLIELGMEERKEAIDYPWDIIIQQPNQPNRQWPSGTKIIDIFDESGGSLLILGEPGSGKTTMLLELTRQLIARAQANLTEPMPVVLNLSSWAEKRLPIDEWLVEELNTKYNIPKRIGHHWVKDNQLLFLLDGLDEVKAGTRPDCIKTINQFLGKSLTGIVICSRFEEYRIISAHLRVEKAILLQPLSTKQVDTYLARMGNESKAIRETLQTDTVLQELAQSPLILSVLNLAYGKSIQVNQKFDSIEAGRKQLFDNYIAKMFQRRGVGQDYSPKQTLFWLVWLAQKMSQHDQSVFLLEHIQPSWLAKDGQRRLYIFTFVLVVGLTGALSRWSSTALTGGGVGFSIGSDTNLVGELVNRITGESLIVLFCLFIICSSFGLVYGLEVKPTILLAFLVIIYAMIVVWTWPPKVTFLIMGLIFWFIYGLNDGLSSVKHGIKPVEILKWSWKESRKGVIEGLFGGLISKLILLPIDPINSGLYGEVVNWLMVGLVSGGIVGGLRGVEIETRIVPNQGISQSGRNAILIGAFVGLLGGFISGIVIALAEGIGIGLAVMIVWGAWFGLIAGLNRGGAAYIQHFVLRYIL